MSFWGRQTDGQTDRLACQSQERKSASGDKEMVEEEIVISFVLQSK
jgi:hypothetical protein